MRIQWFYWSQTSKIEGLPCEFNGFPRPRFQKLRDSFANSMAFIIQDIRNDVESLLSREDEIVNEVVKQVITKLASTLDGYELVSNSTIDRLNQKVEELNKQLSEKKDVA